MTPRLLLSGHDTIECAYYLAADQGCLLDYERLAVEKEELRLSKSKKPKFIKLGSEEFMLASHGTGSGYPFLIENDAFSIQFGEFNQPSFFVTFRSIALWHSSARGLHGRFTAWAASLGLRTYQPERLSRVDFTFDYHLPVIDFDEDNFVSNFVKDSRRPAARSHRRRGRRIRGGARRDGAAQRPGETGSAAFLGVNWLVPDATPGFSNRSPR